MTLLYVRKKWYLEIIKGVSLEYSDFKIYFYKPVHNELHSSAGMTRFGSFK